MEETKIKYYIQADHQLRRYIAENFHSSLPAVARALNYTDNSKKARLIRTVALEHGAVKMEVREAESQKA